jgi:hypothetical protein
MRILTKDGRDVTNSAGRGSKTKEQRDHAHLMRVIKACDACRRKKTRCDPSHKRRTTSSSRGQPHSQRPSESSVRSTKKARTAKRTAAPEPQVEASATTAHSLLDNEALLDTPTGSYDSISETPDDFWLQYVNFEGPAPFPEEYNLANPFGSFSSHSASENASPLQPLVPFPSAYVNPVDLSAVTPQEPRLPYLQSDGLVGTDYVDFNLYSPASDFVEEDAEVSKSSRSRTASYQQRHPDIAHGPRLPERGVPLFNVGQNQHPTTQASSDDSTPQSTFSTWSLSDVDATGLQHAASFASSSTLLPQRRRTVSHTAGTQDQPISDGLGATTSISRLYNTRGLPTVTQDAIVSSTLPPDRQASSRQQTTSSSYQDVVLGVLSTTGISPSSEYAVPAGTPGLDEAKARGLSYSQAVTAGSRHILGAPQTSPSSSQAGINPVTLSDLSTSSSNRRGAALVASECPQTTSEALFAINTQFPAHPDGEMDAARPASSLSSESVAGDGFDRPRLRTRKQEPEVLNRHQSTVLNSYAGSQTERLRSSPSQGESLSSKAEPATAGFATGSFAVDVSSTNDSLKGWYAAAFGLIAGVLVSAAVRLTSWPDTLHVLLLFLGICHHSADLDGSQHRQEFHGDIVPGGRTDRRGHCGISPVPLARRLHKLSRYVGALRCTVVQ